MFTDGFILYVYVWVYKFMYVHHMCSDILDLNLQVIISYLTLFCLPSWFCLHNFLSSRTIFTNIYASNMVSYLLLWSDIVSTNVVILGKKSNHNARKWPMKKKKSAKIAQVFKELSTVSMVEWELWEKLSPSELSRLLNLRNDIIIQKVNIQKNSLIKIQQKLKNL